MSSESLSPRAPSLQAATTVDEVFAPPGQVWERVSPRLVTVRRLVLMMGVIPALIVVGVLAILDLGWPPWIVPLAAVVIVVLAAWSWWLIGRRVRSWGFAETDDELLVTSGIIMRRLVVVPYGRLQLVDVTAGPLDRAFGVATVQLHTAAAASDATIPGLPPGRASTLRDRLAARGEERTTGL